MSIVWNILCGCRDVSSNVSISVTVWAGLTLADILHHHPALTHTSSIPTLALTHQHSGARRQQLAKKLNILGKQKIKMLYDRQMKLKSIIRHFKKKLKESFYITILGIHIFLRKWMKDSKILVTITAAWCNEHWVVI